MADYESEACYITCSASMLERADRIKQVIIALENQAIIAAENSDIADYSLNDGLINIRTAYRTPTEIANAIDRYEKIYERIIARCSGTRVFSLRDSKAFNLNSRNGF